MLEPSTHKREIDLSDWDTRIRFIAKIRSIWMEEHPNIQTFFDYFTQTYGIVLGTNRIGPPERQELTIGSAWIVDERLYTMFLLKHGSWRVRLRAV